MPRPNSRAIVAALILLTGGAMLGVGYWLKAPCAGHPSDGYEWRRACYSDIATLYHVRDLDKDRFPYLDSTELSRGQQRDVEYPVLTGIYMGLIAAIADNVIAFYDRSVDGLLVFGVATLILVLVTARNKTRALWYALAPTVGLYAFYNWDLLPLAFVAAAFYAFSRRRDAISGIFLGLGASAKLYPAIFLIPLAVARWKARRTDTASPHPGRLGAGFLASALAANMPLLIANPAGWWYPWQFQSERFSNWENVWFMLYRHLKSLATPDWWFGTYPKLVNVVSTVIFLSLVALLVGLEWRRPEFRPYAVCLGVLILWLLTAKVFSPQYMIWVVPFFALVNLRWPPMAAFFVVDLVMWVALSGYYLSFAHGEGSVDFRLTLLEVAVFARHAVLIWLLIETRRATDNAGALVPAQARAARHN